VSNNNELNKNHLFGGFGVGEDGILLHIYFI